MKKFLILSFITSFIFTYIVFSFIKVEINFIKWTEHIRTFYIFCSFCLFFFIQLIRSITII